MKNSVEIIPIARLALSFIPAALVIYILFKWSHNGKKTIYALGRMLLQLTLVGHVLTYIFETEQYHIVLAVLTIMLLAASWIALHPVRQKKVDIYLKVLFSLSVAGIATLALVTQGVLQLTPWFLPRYIVPLAGMIFANAMNSISLALERYESESQKNLPYYEARRIALQTSLIPLINSLLAVGIVSLPGMMTGQILSGVHPLVAVRYQIMVMCMIFGSGGLSTVIFLILIKPGQGKTKGKMKG